VDRSDPRGKEDRLFEVLLDYLESSDRGLRPDAEELLARFPELAPELREFLDTYIQVETLSEPIRSMSLILRDAVRSQSSVVSDNSPTVAGESPAAAAGLAGRPEEELARWLGKQKPAGEAFPVRVDPAPQGEIGRLGSYRLLEVVGSGGMGVVFRGEDLLLHRPTAVKVLRPELAAHPAARQRFLREARLAAALTHEHVVTVYQVGEEAGVAFLAMQWLCGLSLEEVLRRARGPLELSAVLRLGRQAALGLAAAHARGFLHRDMKPANLWIETPGPESPAGGGVADVVAAGRVRLLDFGLARSSDDDDHLTGSGVMVGTPAYMSPEQALGAPLDARSDLFSLGVILYRMCTGRLPFAAWPRRRAAERTPAETPRPVRELNPAIPPELDDLVTRLLATDPAGRPGSAAELAERLEALGRRPAPTLRDPQPAAATAPAPRPAPRKARRRGLIAALVALAVLLPLGYVFGGVVVRYVTNRGEVVVDVDDPDAQVTVKEGDVTIDDRKGRRRVTLAAGEHELQVTVRNPDGQARSFTKVLVLRRAGEEVVDVGNELRTTKSSATTPGGQTPAPLSPEAAAAFERTAAEWVLALGGRVRVRFENGEQGFQGPAPLPARELRVAEIDLARTAATDDGLAHLASLASLESLVLNETRISDAGLVHLRGLKKLRTLVLTGTAVTGGGLAPLQSLTELEDLILDATRVDSAGLAHLRPLTKLRQLGLEKLPVDDAGAAHLASLTNLRRLNLNDSKVTDAGLAHLKALTNLQALQLSQDVRVGNAGLQHLLALKDLQVLDLNRTGVDSAGLEHFGALKELHDLILINTRVGDAGLAYLASAGGLQNIALGGTAITDAGLAHLARLKSLRSLDVTQTAVGDAGLRHLAALTDLTGLGLARTKVTDAGLESVAGLRNLQRLDVAGTPVSDAGLACLDTMGSLRNLDLSNTRVTDATMPRIGALKDLARLQLANTAVTDKGLAHLESVKQLEFLRLDGTRVSDAGLVHLLNPPPAPLGGLELRGCRVSATGAAALKGIFPRTQVIWWEPNRRAAEAVFAAGGTVHVRATPRGDDTPIKSAAGLPADYFRLTRASLTGMRQPPRDALGLLVALGDPDFDDLDTVDLTDSGITDADLESLKTLTCRRLILDRTPVCGPGLVHLKNLPRLTELRLACPTLSFLGMRYVEELKDLKHLKRLSLAGSGATDDSLKHLHALKGLEDLDLTDTKATAEGAAALRKELPRCNVRTGPAGGR
jgi:Leucine-rich repeat (LRR) protein/tRNA A-37 threonylcarbamoyl transferase component Bud32